MGPLPNVPAGYDLQISRMGRGDETDFTLEVHLTEGVALETNRGVRVSFWITFEKDKDRRLLQPGEVQRKKYWNWDIQLLPRDLLGPNSPTTTISNSVGDIEWTQIEVELILGRTMKLTQARTRPVTFYKGVGGRAQFDKNVRYFSLGVFHLPLQPPPELLQDGEYTPEYHVEFQPPGYRPPKRSMSLWNNILGVRGGDPSRGLPPPNQLRLSGAPAFADQNIFPPPPLDLFVPTGVKDTYYHQRRKERQQTAEGFWDMARKISTKRRETGIVRGSGRMSGSSVQFDEKSSPVVVEQRRSRFLRRPIPASAGYTTLHQRSYSTSDLPVYRRYTGGVTKCVFKPFALDTCQPAGIHLVDPGERRSTTVLTRHSVPPQMGTDGFFEDVQTTHVRGGHRSGMVTKSEWDEARQKHMTASERKEWEAQERERERMTREAEEIEDDEINTGKFVLVISKYYATPPKDHSSVYNTNTGLPRVSPNAKPAVVGQARFPEPQFSSAAVEKERLRRLEEAQVRQMEMDRNRKLDGELERENIRLMRLKAQEEAIKNELRAKEIELDRRAQEFELMRDAEDLQRGKIALEQNIQMKNEKLTNTLDRMHSTTQQRSTNVSRSLDNPPSKIPVPKPYHQNTETSNPQPERNMYWASGAGTMNARSNSIQKPHINRTNGSTRRPNNPEVGGFDMERSDVANFGRNGSMRNRGRSNSFDNLGAVDRDYEPFENPFGVSEHETDVGNETEGFNGDSRRFTSLDGMDMTRGMTGYNKAKRNTGSFGRGVSVGEM